MLINKQSKLLIMQSGNFLIGKEGLSIKGFNEYFLPEFKKRKCSVLDILELGSPRGVLVSISGNDLENQVKESVEYSSKLVWDNCNVKSTAHNFQVDNYEVLGIYANSNIASKNFPLLSQKYLIELVEKSIANLEESLERIANSKLSDYMG